jgi:plastocyanin
MILVACAVAVAPPAEAGTIRGRVTGVAAARPPVQESALNPYAGTLGSRPNPEESGATSGSGASDVVIVVDAPGQSAAPRGDTRPQLEQRGQQFHPHVLAVPVGTTVDFPNRDIVFHNVFSYSRSKRFDLGYYGKGRSKSVTFDQPGLVRVFCDIHSTMSAYIYVSGSGFVTQPNADGNFALEGLSDGDYVLTAWHPELGERRFDVSVRGGSAEVNVRF